MLIEQSKGTRAVFLTFFPFLLPGHSNTIRISISKIEMALCILADSVCAVASLVL